MGWMIRKANIRVQFFYGEKGADSSIYSTPDTVASADGTKNCKFWADDYRDLLDWVTEVLPVTIHQVERRRQTAELEDGNPYDPLHQYEYKKEDGSKKNGRRKIEETRLVWNRNASESHFEWWLS